MSRLGPCSILYVPRSGKTYCMATHVTAVPKFHSFNLSEFQYLTTMVKWLCVKMWWRIFKINFACTKWAFHIHVPKYNSDVKATLYLSFSPPLPPCPIRLTPPSPLNALLYRYLTVHLPKCIFLHCLTLFNTPHKGCEYYAGIILSILGISKHPA